MPEVTIRVQQPAQQNIIVSSNNSPAVYATQAALNASGQYLSSLITSAVAGVATINGLSGILNVLGAGDISVSVDGQNIIVSGQAGSATGNYLVSANSGALQLQIDALSGNLPLDLFNTGLNLQNQITSNGAQISAISANLYDSGNYLQLQILNTSGQLSSYYLASNPSGYITGINTGFLLNRQETGELNQWFYPLNSNPSNYVTGDVVRPVQTGVLASEQFVETVSGFLTSLISSSSAGVGSLNGLSGIIDLVGAGNITISLNGQNIVLSGETGSLVPRSETGRFTEYGYVDNADSNLQSRLDTTGDLLSFRILEVSGHSGVLQAQITTNASNISTVSANLFSSGNQLSTWIFEISGLIPNTGSLATKQELFTSGQNLQLQITVNESDILTVSGLLNNYYLANNPSGFLTGIIAGTNISVNNNGNGTFTVNSVGIVSNTVTGISINEENFYLTGGLNFIATGDSIYLSRNGNLIYISGDLSNYVLSSNTGNLADKTYVQNVSGVLFNRDEHISGVLVDLITAASAGVSSINSASGVITVEGAGDITVITNGQDIFVSGEFPTQEDIYNTGQNLQNQLWALSGIAVLDSETGILLNRQETGIFIKASEIQNTYATISNLFSSGNNLQNQLYTLSGLVALDSETGILLNRQETGIFIKASEIANIYATISNLYTTGQNLTTLSLSLSGVLQNQITTNVGNISSLTSNLFNTGNNLQQQILKVSGDAVLDSETGILLNRQETGIFLKAVDIASIYATIANLYSTGNNLQNQLIVLSGLSALDSETGILANKFDLFQSGQFLYPRNNPSGFLTSASLSSYATTSYVNDKSGVLQNQITTNAGNISTLTSNLYNTGYYLELQILATSGSLSNYVLISSTGILLNRQETGQLNNWFYPLNSNPASYLTAASLSSYSTTGYVTGVSGWLQSQVNSVSLNLYTTGNTLSSRILQASGSILSTASSLYATISNLYSTGNNLQNQLIVLSGISVLDSETGILLNRQETGVFATVQFSNGAYATISNLYSTGNLLAGRIVEVSGVAGSLQTQINTLTSNLYTTGNVLAARVIQSSGSILSTISSTYATINNLGATGNNLQSQINVLSGIVALDSETGILLNRQETGIFIKAADIANIYATAANLFTTGNILQSRLLTLSGLVALDSETGILLNRQETGIFIKSSEIASLYATISSLYSSGQFLYPRNNPSGFIGSSELSSYATVANLYSTGNNLQNQIYTLSGIVTLDSETGILLNRQETGILIKATDVANLYATIANLYSTGNALSTRIISSSGVLQTQITTNANNISTLTSNLFATGQALYPRNNPSGFLTGIIAGTNITVQNNNNGSFTINAAGGGGGDGTVNTGELDARYYPRTGNPSGYLSAVSGTLTINGSDTITNGQFLIGSTAENAFIDGGLYGQSGIELVSGNGVVGIKINQSLFVTPSNTGNLVDLVRLYNSGQFLYPRNNPSGFITGIVAGNNITVQNNNNGTFTVNSTAEGGEGGATQEQITALSGYASRILKVLYPEDAQYHANFPQFRIISGSFFPISVLAYDASANESAFWKFEGYNLTGSNLSLDIYWYADNATTNSVVWFSQVAAITPNIDTQDVETKTFGVVATGVQTHLGTVGQRLHKCTILMSDINSMSVEDVSWIRIGRSGANVTDNMANDAFLERVVLRN